jgi:hypothetical protein
MFALTEMSLRQGRVVFSDQGRTHIKQQLQIIDRKILQQAEHSND